MQQRALLLVTVLAIAGMCAAVARPVVTYARMTAAERLAARTLVALADAQRAFRSGGGAGGYATEMGSLTTPCPGEAAPAFRLDPRLADYAYALQLRAAASATPRGVDCHGRPTASDYYAAVGPSTALAGRQALAVTSRARVFVFFDGIPPVERDMAAGGLATPLDALPTFRIP